MDHHYIFGKTTDFLTGETLVDTHDERYRQDIARILVEDKGYDKSEIRPRLTMTAHADENNAELTVDFAVSLADRVDMIIRYAPGSLVTRRRPCLAASRILEPYQIPVVAVVNGEDAEILDGESGDVISQGLESIPSRSELQALIKNASYEAISSKRKEMESRIIYAFEAVGHCNCC